MVVLTGAQGPMKCIISRSILGNVRARDSSSNLQYQQIYTTLYDVIIRISIKDTLTEVTNPTLWECNYWSDPLI